MNAKKRLAVAAPAASRLPTAEPRGVRPSAGSAADALAPFREKFARIRAGTCIECYFSYGHGQILGCHILGHGVAHNGGACTAFVSGDMVEALAAMMGAEPVGTRDTSLRLKLPPQ